MVQGAALTATARIERFGDFLLQHIEGIAAYCDHQVRFGVVESLITAIKAVLRRSRGMCDQEMLLLKLKWVIVHATRSAGDLVRFWPFNRCTQIGETEK
jgi:hypothetical protein